MDDAQFFDRFEEQGYTLSDEYESTFRLYHLLGAHGPYTLDEYGNRSDIETSETIQTTGVFYGIGAMLQQMKELGVYDDSTIIIISDHGDLGNTHRSTMLIKPSGNKASDLYQTSTVPASLFDVGMYLAKINNIELSDQPYGTNIDEIQEGCERERHCFVNQFDAVNEYWVDYSLNNYLKGDETDYTNVNKMHLK